MKMGIFGTATMNFNIYWLTAFQTAVQLPTGWGSESAERYCCRTAEQINKLFNSILASKLKYDTSNRTGFACRPLKW